MSLILECTRVELNPADDGDQGGSSGSSGSGGGGY
jgi:hypothetical protein